MAAEVTLISGEREDGADVEHSEAEEANLVNANGGDRLRSARGERSPRGRAGFDSLCRLAV